jgi:hypothetical protein
MWGFAGGYSGDDRCYRVCVPPTRLRLTVVGAQGSKRRTSSMAAVSQMFRPLYPTDPLEERCKCEHILLRTGLSGSVGELEVEVNTNTVRELACHIAGCTVTVSRARREKAATIILESE